MHLVWFELHTGVSLILSGNPYLWRIVGYTLKLTVLAAGTATVLGLPLGLWLGLSRFRGRGLALMLANAGLALPPVLVATTLFVFSTRGTPLAPLSLIWTTRGVYVGQTILALPYVVALSATAVDGIAPGLLGQARLLGAGRLQLAALALSEARTGIITALTAAVGTCLSEVAVIAILGGNVYGYDQTLASATLFEVNGGSYPDAVGLAIVLLALVVLVMGGLGLLQQRSRPAGARPRAAARRKPAGSIA